MSTLNTNVVPVPMFASSGWTTSLNEKADGILSQFFEADAFQSELYAGNVSSMQYLVQQYNNDPVQMVTNTKSTLEKLLGRYYPEGILVDVTSTATNPSWVGSQYDVKITAQVTENGVVQSFGYLVSAENSIINKIARINNSGPAF